MDNEPIILSEIKIEIECIKKEAALAGYSLSFDSVKEYRTAIEKIRELRENRPSCYRRIFEPTAPQCRVCEVAKDCGENVELKPLAARDLEPILCKICQIGRLNIECRNDRGEIVDYACTTLGCEGTIIGQSKAKEIYARIANQGLELMRSRIVEYVKANPCLSKEKLFHAIGADQDKETEILATEAFEQLRQEHQISCSDAGEISLTLE
jgi:hypothetical protein